MPRSFVLPGQPRRYPREFEFKIEHLKLEIEPFFESQRISAKTTYKIRPLRDAICSLTLDAVDLEFKHVRVNGKDANFETLHKSVSIDLGFDLESTAILEIEYNASPKKGLYFRGPTKTDPSRVLHLFTQGQAEDSKHWYPTYDYPNMRFTSEIHVTAPEKMLVVANGKLVSNEVKGSKRLWHFSQEVPHPSYLLSVIVGDYQKISAEHDGISVEYYLPENRAKDAARSFGKTPNMLDFFGKVTGQKYPYPKYAQTVVSDFMFGGMENISATTLTDRTLHDERAHLDFQSENLVSHELAHQWFGDYLTCKDWSHAWLNEGFATYFNALFREFDEGWEDFQYSMLQNFEKLSDDINDRYHRRIVEDRYWDPDELFDSHTYEKGSWVLNAIRGVVGDEFFWKAIQLYVQNCKLSSVETSDFRKSLEKVSGLDFERFFDEWLYSPGFPDYVVDYSFDEKALTARLDVEQTNVGVDDIPLFTTPIEVVFHLNSGIISKKISVSDKKSSFFFRLSSRPLNISFDPKNWILKKLKFRKPKEMLLHQLVNDENSMERIRAAQDLSEYKTLDVIQALGKCVDTDGFWGVRLEAAKYLGKIGTKDALEALLLRKNHKDHKARRGVAKGLQYFANLEESGRAVDSLIYFLNNDESYYTRAYAANSLGFYANSEKAYTSLVEALKQDSMNDQIRYRAFLGFVEMKNARALPLAIDYLKIGKEFQGRNAAAYAVGKLGRGNPEALNALLSMKDIDEFRVRAESAFSISYLEDPSVIPQLETWLSQDASGYVRRRLRETINILRKLINSKS